MTLGLFGDVAVAGMIVILVLVLVITLVVLVTGFTIYLKVSRRIKETSKQIFGTEDPIEGIKQVELAESNTPKSVSGVTSIYLPQITKDFPEFNLSEMVSRVEMVLTSYLRAIDEGDVRYLSEGSEELKESLRMEIQMNRDRGIDVNHQSVRTHQTEINQYRKEKGMVSIVFQTSVESIYFVKKGDRVVDGYMDRKTQARYNTVVSYVQDREKVLQYGGTGIGMNCPNCGGPLTQLGAKHCKYCGTPIVEFNIKIWDFTSVKKV